MSAALRHPPPTARMTVAEFLSMPEDGHGLRWELVDGEPICMAPPSQRHAAVQAEVTRLLGNALRAAGSPCRVLIGPGVQPREESDWNVRIPDVAVECSAPNDEHLTHNPVLAVEVLSPGNERKTRRNVWVYRALPSMREILLLYGWKCAAELHRRRPNGSWPDRPDMLGPDSPLVLETAHLSTRLREAYVTTNLIEGA